MQTIQFSSSSALFANRLPANGTAQKSQTQKVEETGSNPSSYTVVNKLPRVPAPYFPQVKFGFACGICPICVGSVAFAHQVENIKALSHKVDADHDVQIKSGQGALEIRKAGAQTGGDVGRKYIGNEDGTRAQRLSTRDYPGFLMAALPRAYETPESENYKVIGRLQHASKGMENGLYKALVKGLKQVKETETFSSEATPSLQEHLLQNLGNRLRAFGLYHHVAEGPRVRATERTDPGLVGYVSTVQLRPHELLVPSIRELPGFETLGAAPGGLMNMLSMATLHGGYKAVYIAVEPWQHELKSYLHTLKDEYKIPVQALSQNVGKATHDHPAAAAAHDHPPAYAEHEAPPTYVKHDAPPAYEEHHSVGAMPREYRDFMHEMDLSHETVLYKIPLDQMKANHEAIPADEKDKGKRDTQLMESIRLPDPKKSLLDAEHEKALRAVPRFKDVTISKAGHAPPGGYEALQDRPIPHDLMA